MLENTGHIFHESDFNYSATNVDALSNVKIVTLPASGTLTFDGAERERGRYVVPGPALRR